MNWFDDIRHVLNEHKRNGMKAMNKSQYQFSGFSRPARTSGFSLIELLVVLVILGLIAGLVVPNIIGRTEVAKSRAAKAAVQQLSSAVDGYYLDIGNPPDSLEDLVKEPGGVDNWRGPYAKTSLITDPWGNTYQYIYPGEHGEYDIISYGADKTQGGEGKNVDINNWD
jgi:general secretion pathway protein G